MKLPAGSVIAAQEDLGGGFQLLRRENGNGIIISTKLRDQHVLAAMSPAPLDGRLDADITAWLESWGFDDPMPLRWVNQVHGTKVLAASSVATAEGAPSGDGLWTNSDADLLLIKSADCAVIWIFEPKRRLLAMLHAGWRGLAAGIVVAGVDALRRAGGDPQAMQAAVGPHLRPCCFEIGPEVASRFERYDGAVLPAGRLKVERKRRDSVALDVSIPIIDDLRSGGIPSDSISVSTACTRCRADIFHSYRGNGPGGPLMASVGAQGKRLSVGHGMLTK